MTELPDPRRAARNRATGPKGVGANALAAALLAGASFLALLFGLGLTTVEKATVSGIVLDNGEPVPGAVVRVQATEHKAVSGPDGLFELTVPKSRSGPLKITAWAKGYFIGGPVEALSGLNNVTVTIHRHSDADNAEYSWLPSLRSAGQGENQGCAECHFRGKNGPGPSLPVDEWLEDAHSRSAVNPRFLSLYLGTDLSGRRSPPTRYTNIRDYGTFPLPPPAGATYFGPGYKLDYPDHAGNCSACHLPAAAVNAPYDTDPSAVKGVGAEGVGCDFCHKIWDVRLDPVTGLPFENRPGVLSYEFRRPFEGHQFFAGPLDDVAPGEDTYSELQKKSQICAPCHFGVFWDTVVYDSFGEWLRSPYSDAGTGKTCQDCHMPSSGAKSFALPEKGGLERDPGTVVSHRMPGARDRTLLENAVTMTLEAVRDQEGIRIKTMIVNDLSGHHVPTDSPIRHVILVVRAFDEDGSELKLATGPVLPVWCGTGDPANGDYAGLPGKVFVKLLEEAWTGTFPTAAYWNPTRIVMDTRLAAFEKDVEEFVFAAPGGGKARVEAALLYRRAFKALMDRKGWNEPDIVMESVVRTISQAPQGR
jgi:mono/diheme cytochrome c family protein